MYTYDFLALLDNLETARIYAGAEFERLFNCNQYIDACIFQSIRDTTAENINLLKSYEIFKSKSEKKKEE